MPRRLPVRKGKQAEGNFKILLLSSSIIGFATGLFTPFYIVFIQKFGGGIENFGMALGLLALVEAVTAYPAGRYSDRIGRKPMMMAGLLAIAGIVIAYTLISELWQLYVLQVIFGMASAISGVVGASFLGDLTKKATRGKNIGMYTAVTGVLTALAMMLSGFLAKDFGLHIIFYIYSGAMLLATCVLSLIRE